VFGERIFFPKTLPLRPGQQVRCLIKSQRNYAGLTLKTKQKKQLNNEQTKKQGTT